MKPGDRAMLVSEHSISGLYVMPVTIKSVTKTGIVSLEDHPERYRLDGTRTGKRDGYHSPPKLVPWDHAIWQKYQMQLAQKAAASNLFRLGEIFQRTRGAAASTLWESLPYAIRQLVETKNDG